MADESPERSQSISKPDPKEDRKKFQTIRDKWCIRGRPERPDFRPNAFLEINEQGTRKRIECLQDIDGPFVGTGTPDKFLAILAGLRTPQAGVLIDFNPLVTEVLFPYYCEAISASNGDPETFIRTLKNNAELLDGLLTLVRHKYGANEMLTSMSLGNIERAFGANQAYLGNQAITNPSRFQKVFELVTDNKVKALSDDLSENETWQTAFQNLERMGASDPTNLIDISNIASEDWSGTRLIRCLKRTFQDRLPSVYVLGSGYVPNKPLRPKTYPFQTRPEELVPVYEKHSLFGSFYKEKSWAGDQIPWGGCLPGWIGQGEVVFAEK